jgi:hypothetical protein
MTTDQLYVSVFGVCIFLKVACVWVLNGNEILAKNRLDHTHITSCFVT